MANKYAESRTRASKNYHEKNYTRVYLYFQNEKDADLIAEMEKSKEEGISPTEYVRKLFEERHSI